QFNMVAFSSGIVLNCCLATGQLPSPGINYFSWKGPTFAVCRVADLFGSRADCPWLPVVPAAQAARRRSRLRRDSAKKKKAGVTAFFPDFEPFLT
ncbi:MAG TPA: hypothetical protein PK671_14780, partial [Candidatus Obscuribacter sp.]|nr:hypothetical protein [Candidatus Obscuribacter sp.]